MRQKTRKKKKNNNDSEGKSHRWKFSESCCIAFEVLNMVDRLCDHKKFTWCIFFSWEIPFHSTARSMQVACNTNFFLSTLIYLYRKKNIKMKKKSFSFVKTLSQFLLQNDKLCVFINFFSLSLLSKYLSDPGVNRPH